MKEEKKYMFLDFNLLGEVIQVEKTESELTEEDKLKMLMGLTLEWAKCCPEVQSKFIIKAVQEVSDKANERMMDDFSHRAIEITHSNGTTETLSGSDIFGNNPTNDNTSDKPE